MKRLSTIIMALALVLGMSQCKKQETPATGNITPTNPGVHITVNVGENEDNGGKGENGERHNIAPAYGLFSFSSGDQLYVGHNGKYVGTLTFSNGFFDGTIYPDQTVTDQPLHFYFVGNAAVTGTPEANQTTSLSINIANQRQNLPVLSYGASTKPFTGTGTTYSTTLKNKCALVRFDLQNEGDYEVTLSNVPTLATVNFANPTAETAIVATEGQTNANMTLYGESGNTMYRWAILLPGTNLSPSVHTDLTWNGEGELPVMGNNTYINSGIQIANVVPTVYYEPTEAQKAYFVKTSGNELTKFSVDENKKVYFSKANLRAYYDATSHPTGWSFHDTQYGDADGNLDSYGKNHIRGNDVEFSTANAYGDRFTWGYGADYSITEYEGFYNENHDLSVEASKDWGCVFTESSPEGGHWRTLSAEEWDYLLNNTARGDKRFLKVDLMNYDSPNASAYESIFGIFVFPDDYAGSDLTGNYVFNGTTSGYIFKPAGATSYVNGINLLNNEDANKMLAAGAVFLPAAGFRYNNYYYNYYYYNGTTTAISQNPNAYGHYWTSTHINSDPEHQTDMKAFAVYFDNSCIKIQDENTTLYQNRMNRNRGCCVRLVWDANPN